MSWWNVRRLEERISARKTVFSQTNFPLPTLSLLTSHLPPPSALSLRSCHDSSLTSFMPGPFSLSPLLFLPRDPAARKKKFPSSSSKEGPFPARPRTKRTKKLWRFIIHHLNGGKRGSGGRYQRREKIKRRQGRGPVNSLDSCISLERLFTHGHTRRKTSAIFIRKK